MPLLSKGVVEADRSVPSAVLVAVVDEEHRTASDTARRAAARQRHRLRGRAGCPEVRQADPVRRAPRHPVRPLPGRRRPARRDQGHPQRRADRGRPDHLDPARRGSPAGRPPQRTGATVIRTHDAGSLRPSHVDTEVTLSRLGGAAPRPRGSGVHRPARGQRGRAGRHPRRGRGPQPAQRVLPEGHRHGQPAPGGQPEPQPAHRRGRGDRHRRRGAQPGGRRCRSRSTTT